MSCDVLAWDRLDGGPDAPGPVENLLGSAKRSTRLSLNGVRTERSRASQPLTLSTFDFGMAVVDAERVSIVVRTGED